MAIVHKAGTTKRRQLDLENDATITMLKDLTKEQIATYIDNNITDLASAKEFLKKLTMIAIKGL